MKKFKEVFLWAMNMKLYMGIYFVAIVSFSSVMSLVQGKAEVSFVMICTALVASIIIAILQVLILDNHCDYSKGIFFLRTFIWMVISTLIVGTTAVAFKWFEGLSQMNYLVFTVIMAIAFIMMLVGEKFEQEASSERLNKELKSFQKK